MRAITRYFFVFIPFESHQMKRARVHMRENMRTKKKPKIREKKLYERTLMSFYLKEATSLWSLSLIISD